MQKNLWLILVLFGVLLNACSTRPEKPVQTWSSESGEVRPAPETSKAVVALLGKANRASQQGELNTAESYLDRALRIEPRNANLWLYMAKLRLHQQRPQQAIQFARKSLALDKSDKALRVDCWRVIAHAQQQLGNMEEALQAQNKAREIEAE